MRALALAAVLAAPLLAAPALAQDAATPGAPGAEAVVGAYTEAFAAGDHVAAARLLDPVELAEFVDLIAVLDGAEPDPDREPAEAFADFLAQLTGAEPRMGEAMETLRATVLGSVAEGDSLRHVVVRSRMEMAGVEAGGVQATTARWDGDRWVVTFDARMRQFKATLQALDRGDG